MAQLRGYHRSHSDSIPPTERAYRRAARELRDFHRTRSLDVILEEDFGHHHHPAAAGVGIGGTAGGRDDDDDANVGMTMMRTGCLGSRSSHRGLKKNKCASMCLADMAVEGSDSVEHDHEDDTSQEEEEDEASSQHSDHHHQHHPHSWGHFIEDDQHSGDDAISRRHYLLPSAGRGSYRIGLFHHRASGREKHLHQGFGQS